MIVMGVPNFGRLGGNVTRRKVNSLAKARSYNSILTYSRPLPLYSHFHSSTCRFDVPKDKGISCTYTCCETEDGEERVHSGKALVRAPAF